MKFYNILSLSAFFLFSSGLFAQDHHDHSHPHGAADKYCNTVEAAQKLIEGNPEFAPLIEQAEAQLEAFTRDFARSGAAGARDTKIIPVVFHIIHANGSENISDAQVDDAIRILNEDFNLQNSDAAFVIDEFESIVADVGVEFRLAKLDPNGNCTNGIVRVVSNTTFSGGENLKEVSPAWPRQRYMNVWVARDLSGGAAGYTYNPSSVSGFWGAQIDGIVIRHNYVGSIGTGSYQLSRALTHEVGHWINLAHPWGSSNTPGIASNCEIDDNVSDTPNTIGWTTCSLSGQSCGSLDNVQNFMEYSYCSRMFTEGQRTRMLAALNSNTASRNNLWSNSNLVQTGVLTDGELCSVNIDATKTDICAGDSIVFTDMSYHNVTERTWTFEGGSPQTATGQQVVVYYNQPGTYNVSLQIGNGVNTISEQYTGLVFVKPTEGDALPYSQDFEDYNQQLSDPADFEEEWQYGPTLTSEQWQITGQAGGASGSYALRLPNRDLSPGDVSEIWSMPIDLSNTNTDVTISFKYAYSRRNPSVNERFRFWVSSDCGESWSLKGIWSNDFATGPFTNTNWYPSTPDHWEQVTINNINDNQLVSNFRFKFEFESDGGNNFYIEDINITGPVVSSIPESELLDEVNVFPVPAADILNVRISGSKSFTYQLNLMNALGQQVYALDRTAFGGGVQQFSVDVSSLAAGIYHLVIQAESGERIVKRVVVSR